MANFKTVTVKFKKQSGAAFTKALNEIQDDGLQVEGIETKENEDSFIITISQEQKESFLMAWAFKARRIMGNY